MIVQNYPPTVLATSDGLRSPRGISLDPTYCFADVHGNKVARSGSLVATLPSGLGRIFPASKATAATTTSQTSVTVANATVFAVGESITINGSTAVGTIASINYLTNVITLAANAANAVAIGDLLITDASATGAQTAANLQGIIISHIDLVQADYRIGIYTSASIYVPRMPAWNSTIGALFPEIYDAVAPSASYA